MTEIITRPRTRFVAGGPESLFRVGPVTNDRDLTRGSMRTGDWMLSPGGGPCLGSLGVLADDILGYAVVAERPDGHWAVSTEISVEFCSDLPVDGSTLHAESHAIEFDLVGGLSRGRIVDRLGRTIALGSERVRFIPETPSAPAYTGSADVLAEASRFSDASGIPTPDLLGATTLRHDGGATVLLPATRGLSNPMGNLHGGISLCASEIAGLAALQSGSHPLVTASIHIAFLRPVAVDDRVTFTAKALHEGRSMGVAQVISHNQAGKVCTIATVICHDPS
ncbi:MAG: hotdog fold thioesterase [Actinomycetota bacterium]